MKAKMGFKKTALVWITACFAIGCHYENAGSIRKSPEVALAFESLHVNSNYRYYFLNQENNPYGVVGLESAYWIKDPAWREVEAQSETFRKVVGLVQSFPIPGGYTEGFTVHDPQGMEIGVWYSSLVAGITIDPETKRVSITTATPWLSK